MLRDLRRQIEKERRGQASPAAGVSLPWLPARKPDAALPDPAQLDEPLPPELAEALEKVQAVAPRLHASLARLNAWQLRAVLADDPAALVRAQVGSGKTAVLVHKVLYLHLVAGVPVRDLAVLTFTNRAAGEIRTRIEALAPPSQPGEPGGMPLPRDDLWLLGTFHGVARSLLGKALPIENLGWKRGFRVLDEAARQALWERLIKAHKLDVKYPTKLAQRMEALRNGKVRYGQMARDDDLPRLRELADAEKKRCNVLDFDDLIAATTTLLQQAPLPRPPAWIIVDEFQDCEPRELELLRRLRGPDTKVFCVGDPFQSIYAWRGSAPDLFDRVQQELNAVPYDLPVNYRSTTGILAAARAVLGGQTAVQAPVHLQAGAQLQTSGRLLGVRGPGQKITIRRHHNPFVEGLYLADRLRSLHQAGVPWRELAILYRTRRQGAVLREVLVDKGIPCVEVARVGLREVPAARWTVALLTAGLVPSDPDAALGALLDAEFGVLAPRQVQARSFETFRSKDGRQGTPALQGFLQARRDGKKPLEPAVLRDVTAALDLLERLLDLPRWLAALPAEADLAEALEAHLDLAARLRPTSAQFPQLREQVRKLLRGLQAWCRSEGLPLEQGLPQALDVVADRGLQALAEAADPAADAVQMMTLHAAKGLEFRHVFISGANQGLIPLASSWGDASAEAEERRLLFVGLTRAKDGVELAWHAQPAFAQAQPMASPYLLAMPAALTEWLDGSEGVAPVPVPPQPDARPVEQALPWQPGQAVRHPRYGQGTVVSCDTAQVVVDFGKVGERGFAVLMCPLVAV